MKKRYSYICSDCNNYFERNNSFKEWETPRCHRCSISYYWKTHKEESKARHLKSEQTCLEKYGKTKPLQVDDFKLKSINSLKETLSDSDKRLEIENKRKNTCREIYGYDTPAQNKDICLKGMETQRSRNNGLLGWEDTVKQRKSEELAHSPVSELKRLNTNIQKFNAPTVLQSSGNANRLKGYYYNNIRFDSSWELALYIWLVDNDKDFIFHPLIPYEYVDENNKSHTGWPDFLIEGKFYEIKGDQFFDDNGNPTIRYTNQSWKGKYDALIKNNITILKLEDIKKYLRYISDKYGKNYLKEFKINPNKDNILKSSETIS